MSGFLSPSNEKVLTVDVSEQVKDIIIPQHEYIKVDEEKSYDDYQSFNISFSLERRRQLLKDFYSEQEESKLTFESQAVEHTVHTKELNMEINVDQSMIEVKTIPDLNKSLISDQALIDQMSIKEISKPIYPEPVIVNPKIINKLK